VHPSRSGGDADVVGCHDHGRQIGAVSFGPPAHGAGGRPTGCVLEREILHGSFDASIPHG